MHFVEVVDRLSRSVGFAGALVQPLLMLTILVNVLLRYVFNLGMIELEELQWHMNAVVVMCCLAWAYQRNMHVRVDALHGRMGERGRALAEVLGVLFLLLPFAGFLTLNSWKIFEYSWRLKEGSPMPSGLPARYIIKGVMAAGFALLFLQGLSVLLKSLAVLIRPGRSADGR